MYKPIRKADLIIGGTAVKQGEIFTLGFQLFDANGLVIVPTVGQTITVKVANKTGVVFETVASVVDEHIEFTIDENIGAGKMRVELTVADGANVLQKYPANGYIELFITASLDDIGTGTIYTVTAAEMFTRIEGSEEASASAVQTAGEAVVIAEGAVETADAVRADFDLVVAEAGSSNPEVVLARGEFATLEGRLDDANQQLADIAKYQLQVVSQDIANPEIGQMWLLTSLPPVISNPKVKFATPNRIDFQAVYSDIELDECAGIQLQMDVENGDFSFPVVDKEFLTAPEIVSITTGNNTWGVYSHNKNIVGIKYKYRLRGKDVIGNTYGAWVYGEAYARLLPNFSFEDDTNADNLPDGWSTSADASIATRLTEIFNAPQPTLDGLYKCSHSRISNASAITDGGTSVLIFLLSTNVNVTYSDIVNRFPNFKLGFYPIGSECVKDPSKTYGYYVQLRAYFRDSASNLLAQRTAYLFKQNEIASSNYDLSGGVIANQWNDISINLRQWAIDAGLDVSETTQIAKFALEVRYVVQSSGTTSCGGYLDAFRL